MRPISAEPPLRSRPPRGRLIAAHPLSVSERCDQRWLELEAELASFEHKAPRAVWRWRSNKSCSSQRGLPRSRTFHRSRPATASACCVCSSRISPFPPARAEAAPPADSAGRAVRRRTGRASPAAECAEAVRHPHCIRRPIRTLLKSTMTARLLPASTACSQTPPARCPLPA